MSAADDFPPEPVGSIAAYHQRLAMLAELDALRAANLTLRVAQLTPADRAVLDAADVWLTCRERCNDPDWLTSYPEATDNLARTTAARREAAAVNPPAAAGTEEQTR